MIGKTCEYYIQTSLEPICQISIYACTLGDQLIHIHKWCVALFFWAVYVFPVFENVLYASMSAGPANICIYVCLHAPSADHMHPHGVTEAKADKKERRATASPFADPIRMAWMPMITCTSTWPRLKRGNSEYYNQIYRFECEPLTLYYLLRCLRSRRGLLTRICPGEFCIIRKLSQFFTFYKLSTLLILVALASFHISFQKKKISCERLIALFADPESGLLQSYILCDTLSRQLAGLSLGRTMNAYACLFGSSSY